MTYLDGLRTALIGIGLSCALSGCAMEGPDAVRTSSMASRLQQRGYSVARPPTNDWLLVRREQSPEVLVFTRDTGDRQLSIFLSVRLATESADVRSMQDLIAMESNQWRDTERNRIEHKSVTQSTMRPGACIDYNVRETDETQHDPAGAAFLTLNIGFACVHPTFTGRIVTAMFSERGPAAVVGSDIPADARQILQSVQLESAPGVAASAPNLPASSVRN